MIENARNLLNYIKKEFPQAVLDEWSNSYVIFIDGNNYATNIHIYKNNSNVSITAAVKNKKEDYIILNNIQKSTKYQERVLEKLKEMLKGEN
jgi:hypothetical protein